jgi:hypothetical protein
MDQPMTETDDTQNLRVWQARLEAAQNSQYSDLKASADKWASSIGVLIGAVGSISIILIPKALTEFSSDTTRDFALGFAIAAGVVGLVALGTAVWVSVSWPKVYSEMDAGKYRQQTIDRTAHGVTCLQVSRWGTLAAVLCIIIASSISAADTLGAPPSPVNVLIVHQDGTTMCGPIDARSYQHVVQTTVVAHC